MKTTIQAAAAAITLIASSAAHAQQAVQWKISDGGNGHWYRFEQQILRWPAHRDRAELQGAYLATVTSELERSFVESILFVQEADIWLGGQSNWPAPMTWITGEPFGYAYWCPGGFNPGGGYAVEICGRSGCLGQFCWNIEGELAEGWTGNRAVYEWSADCNADGIVDYGQILQGQLIDADANGVPDICEVDPCPGDITNGGTVDAADLSILLAAWGTNGQAEFNTDIDGSGLVDGGDLALVLGGWGPCPQ